MNEIREIREAILKIAGLDKIKLTEILIGEVKTVDEDNRSCSVESSVDNGNITYSSVGFISENNDGFIRVPAIGSTVLFAKMANGEQYILVYSDITKVICYIDSSNKFEFNSTGFIWNGGTFGGLIKIDNLKTQWDANVTAIKTAVAAALTVIDAQLVALGQAGGSVAAFNTAAASIANLNKTTLENTKIKH